MVACWSIPSRAFSGLGMLTFKTYMSKNTHKQNCETTKVVANSFASRNRKFLITLYLTNKVRQGRKWYPLQGCPRESIHEFSSSAKYVVQLPFTFGNPIGQTGVHTGKKRKGQVQTDPRGPQGPSNIRLSKTSLTLRGWKNKIMLLHYMLERYPLYKWHN